MRQPLVGRMSGMSGTSRARGWSGRQSGREGSPCPCLWLRRRAQEGPRRTGWLFTLAEGFPGFLPCLWASCGMVAAENESSVLTFGSIQGNFFQVRVPGAPELVGFPLWKASFFISIAPCILRLKDGYVQSPHWESERFQDISNHSPLLSGHHRQ